MISGWSYGLKGNLAKAPKFEAVSNFDKSQYSLFRVHLKTDKRGFVWVNLDSNETPGVEWVDSFGGVDEQPRLQVFDMSEYRYDHSWDMKGEYNWKTLVDNYNEVRCHPAKCLKCELIDSSATIARLRTRE